MGVRSSFYSAATLLAALLLAFPVAAQSQVEGELHADQPGPVISRQIYGHFAEHLGRGIYDGVWVGHDSPIPNTRGIRNDVTAALRAIRVPVVRWPGGCFADEYHWRDGIGPSGERPVRKNNWWGGTPESNAFGTHEFFDFAEQIGAEAYVSVNLASSTPTEMREWLEYMTSRGQDSLAQERRANGRDEPFPVHYVGIGNESWGCGGAMTPEYYANEYRRFAVFFHKNGSNFHLNNDNNAVRVASGPNNLDTHWMDVVTAQAGPLMDAISLHFYTTYAGEWTRRNEAAATGFAPDQWNAVLYQASRMEDVISRHEAVLDRNDPARRIGLYVDEWGTWYAPEPGTEPGHLYQQNTLRDALVAAVNFNIFHRHAGRVRMANIAQTVNVLQAMLLTDGANMARTPTYHAFALYLPFQDATFLPLDIASPTLTAVGEGEFPAISGSAARSTDGRVRIALANLDADQPYALSITLGDLIANRVTGDILTASAPDAHNLPGQAEAVSPVPFNEARIAEGKLLVELPARSLVVLALD